MMRRGITTILLALAMMLGSANLMQAQDAQKIGHINTDELLSLMPETKAAQQQIEAYRNQLEKDLQDMETELEAKIQSFRENEKLMTNLARESKTKEIQDLQARIQAYGLQAQEDFGNKQEELLSPILQKASDAIKSVATKNGFTYVLDSSLSKGTVLFAENGIDILPLVKTQLGIL